MLPSGGKIYEATMITAVIISIFMSTVVSDGFVSLPKIIMASRHSRRKSTPSRIDGNEEIFMKALGDHAGIIYKICRLYCNNHADEADLYQEIVLHLWKAFPSFKNKSSVSTWMYSIAVKTAGTLYYPNRLVVEFTDTVPEIPSMPDQFGGHFSDELRMFFHSLGKTNRIIVLLLMERYSRQEIAMITGLTSEAVTMRITRMKQHTSNSK